MFCKRLLLVPVVAGAPGGFGGPAVTYAQGAAAVEGSARPKKRKPRADNPNGKTQAILKEAGPYQGDITGHKNPETTEAPRKYKEQNGLKVTGTLRKTGKPDL